MQRFLIHIALVASGTALVGPVAGEASTDISQATLDALDPTRPGRLACRGFFGSAAALERRLALAQDYATRLGAPGGPIRLFDHIGKNQLPATGLSADARRYFDQGVALVYGFNHKAAIRSFAQAAERDPNCAMCWWGIALANGPNINAGMDDVANRAALEALSKASAMGGSLSPLERDLIAAQKLRYSASSEAERAALDAQYADAMMALAKANPGNDDLQILAAEAAMNTRPWDYWTEDKQPKPRIGEAVGLIETVIARNPRHPQASHLYIHLMENGPQPRQAEAAADELARSGPASLGHLVHMPAHIYYRIGRYADSMTANIAAARADEEYLAIAGDDGLYRYGYYPHNVHFLLTSAQMIGNMHAVASETERLKQILDEDIAKELPWVQAIHAAPAFALAQYASPQAILALTDKPTELAYVDAMRHYARAVAQALAGNRTGFDDEIAALKAAGQSKSVADLAAQGFPAGDLINLALHVAQGRWELANGKPAAAVAHFEAAEEIEATIPYNEPPYWYYPVAQSRGAALYAAGDYAKATAAFRKALFLAPNNGWALYGLSRSEAKAGHRLEAEVAKKKLGEVWQGETAWLDMSRI
ncbi:MAG: tetratricopeptide repeat protein [Erythrobacter sp.]